MKICKTEYCNNEVHKNNRCYWCDLAYRAYEKHDQQARYELIIFTPRISFKSNTSLRKQKQFIYKMLKNDYPGVLPYFKEYTKHMGAPLPKTITVTYSKETIKAVEQLTKLPYHKKYF